MSTPDVKNLSTKERIKQMLHDPENPLASFFDMIEQKARIPREYVFIGVMAFIFIYLIIGHGTGLLVNLVGFVYPAYKSCQAIDSEDTADDTQWLTYWVVYAAFGIVEFFTDLLLSWFPFYFLGKCLFLVWCMLPMQNNGAAVIYNNLIKPAIKKHSKTIEKSFEMAGSLAKDLTKDALSKAKDAAGNLSLKDIQTVQEKVSDLHDQFNTPENTSEVSKKED